MEELTTIPELRRWRDRQRQAGSSVALVPTMGYLHQGHISLITEARRRADVTALSIFVNPLQFGPKEDLARYPRDYQRDAAMAAGQGVAMTFAPDVATMYPPGATVTVAPGPAGKDYEGEFRPGHFSGVLTVVAKLFNLVEPDVACFGQKDIQQAVLVRQMVADLNFPIEIVVVPTVRESDGLALSSRNVYLSPEDRNQGLGLSAALAEAHRAWVEGVTDTVAIRERMTRVLADYAGLQLEYIALLDSTEFSPMVEADADTVVAVAGRVGGTRLIDNIFLGRGLVDAS